MTPRGRLLPALALAAWPALGGGVAAQEVPAPVTGGAVAPMSQVAAPQGPLPEVVAPDVPVLGYPGLDDVGPEAMPEPDPVQAAAPPVEPRSLAAMRADLAVLGRSLQSLRAELVASGPSGFTAAGGTAAIGRMDAMEADIARLTGQVEEMRRRVEASIAEASSRAEDIEFRLCEVDPACDLGALTTAQIDNPAAPVDPDMTPVSTPSMATDPKASAVEYAAFDRAAAAQAAQNHADAAQQFATFVAEHPASPLVPEAMFLRGEALAATGDRAGAAAAWLDAFTAAPGGARAPQALLNLATAMAEAGRADDACGFFADVPVRFPGTPAALEAATRAEALNCVDPAVAPATQPASGMDPEEAADLADGG